MKKTFLILPFLFLGCKKDNWVTPIGIHSYFAVPQSDIKWLNKPNGDLPANPFKIDSIGEGVYGGHNGYWVSSSNGLVYMMDPVYIRGLVEKYKQPVSDNQ